MTELVPPVISNERVAQIVQAHYTVSSIDSSTIKLLHGYEDRNYYIKELCTDIESYNSKEYVFKVVNQKDSKFPDLFDALSKLMFFIKAEGINSPLPLQPVDVPEENFIIHLKKSYMLGTKIKNDVTYVGFLLTYVPGVPISEVECSPKFLYSIGEFVGKLSTLLQVCSQHVVCCVCGPILCLMHKLLTCCVKLMHKCRDGFRDPFLGWTSYSRRLKIKFEFE